MSNIDVAKETIKITDCSCPDLIRDRAILIDSDISKVLEDLRT